MSYGADEAWCLTSSMESVGSNRIRARLARTAVGLHRRWKATINIQTLFLKACEDMKFVLSPINDRVISEALSSAGTSDHVSLTDNQGKA